MTHFEHARACFQDDLVQGKIGCKFAHIAARRGRVAYAPFPANENGYQQFMEDLRAFINNAGKSVLTVIPESGNPWIFEDGKVTAYDCIYQTILLALRAIISGQLVNHFQERLPTEAQRISQTIHTPFHSVEELLQIMHRDEMRELICSRFIHEGTLALTYIRSMTHDQIETDALIPLTMAPYYTPVHENRQHARFARDFGVVLTRNSEIDEAFANHARDVAEVRDWKTFAVGNDYLEGLHIALQPPDETGAAIRTEL